MSTSASSGRVLAVHSAYCIVFTGARTERCGFRGRLRLLDSQVAPGDMVKISRSSGQCMIDETLPRKNLLERPLIANVDQVVLVTALTHPPIDYRYLDRILVYLQSQSIDAVVCVNKTDVEDGEDVAQVVEIYKMAGYPVQPTSAVTGEGISELADLMGGKTVVFAGASGVGKSKILNRLFDLDIATGTLSKIRRGRHTTRGTTLYRLGKSFVADTPGFSKINMIDCEPHDLAYYYKEMSQLVSSCYYPRCLHKTEDMCAVRDALSSGKIHPRRYATYLELLEQSLEEEKGKYGKG